MEKSIKFSLFMLFIMILSTSFATYAYFTVIFEGTDSSSMEINSAVLPSVIIEMKESLYLDILSEDMLESESNTFKPSVINEISEASIITATASSYGGYSTISYEIYYTPIVPYIKSELNTNESNELVISIYSSQNGWITEETDLTDVTGSDGVLLGEGTIELVGKSTVVSDILDVTLGFYNQDYDQSDNTGKTITGELTIKVLGVECQI